MCTVTERLWEPKWERRANVRSHRAIVRDIRQRSAITAACLDGSFRTDNTFEK